MKTNKTALRISLQFFASEPSSVPADTEIGSAVPTEESGDTSPAVTETTDEQTEAEFEKLIKGGRFENAFKKRTQSIIDKRFKTLKALEKTRDEQQPILDFLSAKYGIDSSSPDLLLEKLQNDSTVGNATPTEENMSKVNADSPDTDMRQSFVSEKARSLSKKWAAEGEELKKLFPSFDFSKELKNPVFTAMLKSGLPLRKAYTAAHSDELLKSAVSGTAKKVAEETFKSIRANGSRVAENGLHKGAGIVRKTDVSSLTGEQIRSILKQVEQGTKIRF